MKKILLIALLSGCILTIAFAQQNETEKTSSEQTVVAQQGNEVSGEGQALLELFKKDILSSSVSLSGELKIEPKEKGYLLTIPQSSLTEELAKEDSEEETVFPEYQIVFNKVSDFNGYPAYEVNLSEVEYLSPMLYKQMKKSGVTVQNFSYKIIFVPALNISVGQGVTINQAEMKQEGAKILVVDQILGKSLVTPLPEQNVKIERATGVEGLFLNLPIGSVRVKEWMSLFEIPSVSLNNLSGEDFWEVGEAKISSYINDLRITSMFLPFQELGTNVSIDVNMSKSSKPGKSDFLTNIYFKDIFVAEETPELSEKFPEYMTISVLIPDIDIKVLRQLIDLNQKVINEKDDQENPSEKQKELESLISLFEKELNIHVNEISFGSKNYSVTLKGLLRAENRTFEGTLNVVNFNFIVPEKKIDEKACAAAKQEAEALMNQVEQSKQVENTMLEQVAEAQSKVSQLCEVQGGMFDFLKPYLATAEHSINEKNQTVDVFHLKYNKEGWYLNDQLVFPNKSEMTEDKPKGTVSQTESDSDSSAALAPLIP